MSIHKKDADKKYDNETGWILLSVVSAGIIYLLILQSITNQ